MLGLMFGIFLARETLLSVDFGSNYWLCLLALLCFAGAALIGFQRKRLLTFGILAGIPELSQKRSPGKLLTEGLYAKVRHPRYIEVFLAVLAYALFANYLGPYVAVVLTVPTIGLIVVLEERELRERFGSEFEDYSRKVPRFIPRISR
jgi:protein-S-isoprenylcysteine O-methyltransferase Ste14